MGKIHQSQNSLIVRASDSTGQALALKLLLSMDTFQSEQNGRNYCYYANDEWKVDSNDNTNTNNSNDLTMNCYVPILRTHSGEFFEVSAQSKFGQRFHSCIVMPWYGLTVDSAVMHGLLVEDDVIVAVAMQIAKNMEQMHSVGICHGNLRPSHIVMDNHADDNNSSIKKPIIKFIDLSAHHHTLKNTNEQEQQRPRPANAKISSFAPPEALSCRRRLRV
jgi:serine/threonine protein kinase